MINALFKFIAVSRITALIVLACSLFGQARAQAPAQAQSQGSWLTFVGNPGDAQADLLEVDATSRAVTPAGPTLDIRVSRPMLRTSTEGIPFRSYTGTVLVDCVAKTARFVVASFYMMPLWEGKSHKTLIYQSSEIRPVQFRFFDPNPLPRIVRASCTNGPP